MTWRPLPAIGPRRVPDVMVLVDPIQVRAARNLLRDKLLCVLAERREATIAELAAAVGRHRATVAYHVRVLALAGLIRVSRTRQVRAISERYYALTAASFVIAGEPGPVDTGVSAMREFLAEYAGPLGGTTTPAVLRLRLPEHRAAQLVERISRLLSEYLEGPDRDAEGAVDVGLVVGAYRRQGNGTARGG